MNVPERESNLKKGHLYDGWFYRKMIDPSLAGIRQRVAKLVPKRSSVMDVGCGTGDQLLHLAGRIESGLGVELSEAMVRTAQKRFQESGDDHIKIKLADARQLHQFEDKHFDIVMSSMVIHEMPQENRIPVLNEMKRLGQTLILVDWIHPQPSRWKNWGTHTIEYFAGREHYGGFRSFMENGGMPRLLEDLELTVLETQITSKGTIQLWVCKP